MDTLMNRRLLLSSKKEYFHFEDPEVEMVVANRIGDGVGTTLAQIKATTGTEFMELEEFTRVSSINGGFNGCTNLKKASIPPSIANNTTSTQYTFAYCSNLEELHINSVIPINSYFLLRTSKLERIYYPSLEIALSITWGISRPDMYGTQMFYFHSGGGRLYINGVQLTQCIVPSTITVVQQACVRSVRDLTLVDFHENVIEIKRQAFADCKELETIILRRSTPPSLSNADTFNGIKSTAKFYVPYSADHSVLDTYKTASYWSTYASKMYELDENGNIPT